MLDGAQQRILASRFNASCKMYSTTVVVLPMQVNTDWKRSLEEVVTGARWSVNNGYVARRQRETNSIALRLVEILVEPLRRAVIGRKRGRMWVGVIEGNIE